MGEYEREVARENPGMLDRDLLLCKHRFERGEYDAAVHAVKLCTHFGLPVPGWLEAEVCAAMQFYFAKGGAEKRGSKGNLARTRAARIDVGRYRIVERQRARGFTREEAINRASEILAGSLLRGSPGEIGDSYDRLAPRYASGRRKPGPRPIRNNSPLKGR